MHREELTASLVQPEQGYRYDNPPAMFFRLLSTGFSLPSLAPAARVVMQAYYCASYALKLCLKITYLVIFHDTIVRCRLRR